MTNLRLDRCRRSALFITSSFTTGKPASSRQLPDCVTGHWDFVISSPIPSHLTRMTEESSFCFVISHSFVIRHSSFVIGHWSFSAIIRAYVLPKK